MTFDPRSEAALATLVPHARSQARAFLKAVLGAGLNIRIIDGSRTFAAQDALFARGRGGNKSGAIVTRARGGFSNHNFGIAWDIGVFDAEGAYIPESGDYAKAGVIGRDRGLTWGGDWAGIVDRPHFQCRSTRTIAQMRALVLANGGDITDPKAMAAIDALVITADSKDTKDSTNGTGSPETPPKSPAADPTAADWQPIDVYLNTRKFDIAAYFKDSRVWVSPGDFTDYFGGSVVVKAGTPTEATLVLEGETALLTGVLHQRRLIVKFADLNQILGYSFRFDSAKKRLTLSK